MIDSECETLLSELEGYGEFRNTLQRLFDELIVEKKENADDKVQEFLNLCAEYIGHSYEMDCKLYRFGKHVYTEDVFYDALTIQYDQYAYELEIENEYTDMN